MKDINPYDKPLKSGDNAERIAWEVQRIGWEVNRLRNTYVVLGLQVVFILDKKLIKFWPQMLQETIGKGTQAAIIPYGTVLLLKLIDVDMTSNEYDNCYFLGNFKLGDVLPGFLAPVL